MIAELIVAYIVLCVIWVFLLGALVIIAAYGTLIWMIVRYELRN